MEVKPSFIRAPLSVVLTFVGDFDNRFHGCFVRTFIPNTPKIFIIRLYNRRAMNDGRLFCNFPNRFDFECHKTTFSLMKFHEAKQRTAVQRSGNQIKDMSGNSLRSHPDLRNDENVGDNR